jgi:hypothetical protein
VRESTIRGIDERLKERMLGPWNESLSQSDEIWMN